MGESVWGGCLCVCGGGGGPVEEVYGCVGQGLCLSNLLQNLSKPETLNHKLGQGLVGLISSKT